MDPFALSLLLVATPLAGVLMFVATRLFGSGNRTAGMICATVGFLAAGASCAVFIVAPLIELGVESAMFAALGGLFVIGLTVVAIRWLQLRKENAAIRAEVTDQFPDLATPTADLRVFGVVFLTAPLALAAGFPMLLLIYGVICLHFQQRWRRLKQANLLKLLAAVAETSRPISTAFPVGDRKRGVWPRRLRSFSQNLDAGLPLSDAAEFAGVVGGSDATLIRAAELVDAVDRELPRISNRATERARAPWRNNGLLGGVTYVTLLGSVFLTVVSFVMYFIVPKFKVIFEDFGLDLPPLTQQLITISDNVASYFWLFVSAGSIWVFALLAFALIAMSGTSAMPAWLLRNGSRRWATPQALRAVGTFLESGISMGPAFRELAMREKSAFWANRWITIANRSDRGEPPEHVLVDVHDLSPTQASGLVAAGRTGASAGPAQAAFLNTLADAVDAGVRRQCRTVAVVLGGSLFALSSALTLFAVAGIFACLVKVIHDLS